MSKITEAKYARRFKLEEYEFEEHQLTAIVEDGETGSQVLLELKAEVNTAFTGESPEKKETKKAPKAKKEKKEKTNAKSKPSVADDEDEDSEDPESEDGAADDEGTEDDESADSDAENDSDSESEEAEEDEDSEDEEESEAPKGAKGKAAKGKVAGKKAFRKKPQDYDRNIEQHKDLFGKVLRSIDPNWKNSEATKLKAKKISQTVEGSPFLNEDGEVFEAFKEEVKKLWKAKPASKK